jgi:hypothetical protein
VRFTSEVDHEGGPIERVIRADELRVEVYGEAPSRSKQIIVAWRDTSFLPNRLILHRDHLGIVANDFGGTIRLGDGEEVRDVIHPLSPAGLAHYRFAVGDTVVLASSQGRIRVVAVQVRPVDAEAPAAVGTLYFDLERAALVRFVFTFTAASYRDATVENITVTLENALQQNARWLPWRQAIVIRRGSPWLELPLRTVLRADWSLDDYQLGVPHAADRFTGPAVAGLRRPTSSAAWSGPLAPQLELLPPTDREVAAAEAEAARALGGQLLNGLPNSRFLADGVSELLHVNRVQGVTPGIGGRFAIGGATSMRLHAGIGASDQRLVARVAINRRVGADELSLLAERTVADIGTTPIISGVLNSLGTAFTGSDRGDYVLLERAQAGLRIAAGAARIDLNFGGEWSTSVASEFTPLSGSSEENPALGAGGTFVVRGAITRRDADGAGWRLDAEGGSGEHDWLRVALDVRAQLALGKGALQFHGVGGAGTGDLPSYRSFVLGGRATLLGVPDRAMGGTRAALAEVAWSLPVRLPTPPIPTLRHLPLPSAVAPFVAAGIAGGDLGSRVPWRATGRLEPVVGARLDLWGPLLRLEGGIALTTGRAALTLDIHPSWWPIL